MNTKEMVDNNNKNWEQERDLKHTSTTKDNSNYYYYDDEGDMMKEQDRLLPIANVGRIMKRILPSSGKISKEAKETMQECASEFISFVTCEASDKCRKEKRKTVNGDDICQSLLSLGFDDYGRALKSYLVRFRDQADAANLQTNGGADQIRKDPFIFHLMDN